MYRIEGSKLTHNGNEIHLFGSNWIGGELKEAIPYGPWGGVTYHEMLDQMKSIGLNSIRFPITHRTIQNVDVSPGDSGSNWIKGHEVLKGKKSMEVFDFILDYCDQIGMRYIFDMHYLDKNGKLPGIWYTPDYSEYQWLEDLKTLAIRYKGRPGFIGIDILNEPNKDKCTWASGDPKTDWKIASEKAFRAIDSVNSDIIVLVEAMSTEGGIGQLLNPRPQIPEDRISYSIHLYGPSVWQDFGEGFKAKNFPQNMPEVWGRIAHDYSHQVNVIIGEFGGKYEGKDKQWQDAYVADLKFHGISSFYWGWTNSSGWDTGGIQADDGYRKLRDDKVKLLQALITPETTFSNETDTPAIVNPPRPPRPEPEVDPEPEYEPLPGDFQEGDIVHFITGEGPKLVVRSVSQFQAEVTYFPPYTTVTIPLELLKK